MGCISAPAVTPAEPLPPVAAQAAPVMGGWFGNWHPPATVAQKVREGRGVLTDVAIFGWQFAGRSRPVCALTFHSGCVPSSAKRPYASKELAQSWAELTGVRTWISHIDLDSARAGQLARVMKNRASRAAMIDTLVDWTVELDADGLDLDWENFAFNDGSASWKRTRPAFVATVRSLAAALHRQGRLLSVTVPAGGQPFWPDGRPKSGSGYTVYDWGAIADSVDRLNLMTYDYSWNAPGPIGPNPWARQVVRSAIAQMGRDNARKIVAGVPLYGKSWPTAIAKGRPRTIGACPARWRPDSTPEVFSVTPVTARQLAAEKGKVPKLDPRTGEHTFRYGQRTAGHYRVTVGKGKKARTVRRDRSCTVSRTVWFSAGKALAMRARMARQEGIAGVFVWNLASTDPGIYRSYRTAMQ